MTTGEHAVTIAICVAATFATRCIPFLVFSSKKPVPAYVQYLGRALPLAIFGMLLVYCLKTVDFLAPPFGLPQTIAIAATCVIHLLKRQMLLSIAGGTACYMLLVNTFFA